MGLGIYQLFHRQYKQAVATASFAIISFYLIKFKFISFLWPGAENLDLGTSILPLSDPFALGYVFLIRPNILLDQIFNAPVKLNTLDFVYRQFAFLSVLSPLSWLTIFPSLFLRFSSTATHFWASNWHYNANLTPFLAVSAIFAISKFKLPYLPIMILLIFFLFTGGLAPDSMVWTGIQNPIQNFSHFQYIRNSFKDIPNAAAVSAQSPLVPHLANRENIYMFQEIYNAEYIILDTALSSYPLPKDQYQNKINLFKKSKNWKIKKEVKTLIIFQKIN